MQGDIKQKHVQQRTEENDMCTGEQTIYYNTSERTKIEKNACEERTNDKDSIIR